MEKIDLIIQGPYNSYTNEIISNYKKLEWVNDIIISCWSADQEISISDCIHVRSEPLKINGIGNRNAQIVTSFNGLKKSTTKFAAKLRSDQKISVQSMNLMYNFMLKNSEKICVMGFYKAFPFHPRDHSFWGKLDNLKELFDIPLEKIDVVGAPPDNWPSYGFYSENFRSECYIAINYLAKKDERVNHMLQNPHKYVFDHAPEINEAKTLNDEVMNKFFVPFPKIDFVWPKHNMQNYHYDFAEKTFGEYWSDY